MELKHVSEDHAARYRESLEYPDLFCGELARARLRWSREFDRVQDCDLTQGRLQWFIGGQLNVSGEQFHKVVGSARDTRTHAHWRSSWCTVHTCWQAEHTCHTRLSRPPPKLIPAPACSTSTLASLPPLHAGSTWASKDTFWKDHEADLAQDC